MFDGSITVESVYGQGVTFIIRLPVVSDDLRERAAVSAVRLNLPE